VQKRDIHQRDCLRKFQYVATRPDFGDAQPDGAQTFGGCEITRLVKFKLLFIII